MLVPRTNQVDKLVIQGRVKVEGTVVKSPKKKVSVDSIIEVRTARACTGPSSEAFWELAPSTIPLSGFPCEKTKLVSSQMHAVCGCLRSVNSHLPMDSRVLVSN